MPGESSTPNQTRRVNYEAKVNRRPSRARQLLTLTKRKPHGATHAAGINPSLPYPYPMPPSRWMTIRDEPLLGTHLACEGAWDQAESMGGGIGLPGREVATALNPMCTRCMPWKPKHRPVPQFLGRNHPLQPKFKSLREGPQSEGPPRLEVGSHIVSNSRGDDGFRGGGRKGASGNCGSRLKRRLSDS